MRRARVRNGNVLDEPRTIERDFWNLHDAFVNVELLRRLMLKAPVDDGSRQDPVRFFLSYRGRFERLYVGLLWVVVEAWQKRSDVRRFCSERASVEAVTESIRAARAEGGLRSMKDVRDYTFHRDKREYWDPGRVGAVGYMHVHEDLYGVFGKMFLAVTDALRKAAVDTTGGKTRTTG